jgi:gliding motility-associated lipoprotein GldD
MYRYLIIAVIVFSGFWLQACQQEVIPKPKAYLYLEYPIAEYHRFISDCPFSFAVSKKAHLHFKRGCDAVIDYPGMKAQIFITYRKVKNNLKLILSEADKLTSAHTVKADAIIPHPFENPEKKVFGLLSEVQGNAASNIQFYATDSARYVITAALYFKVEPNYDSLYPAVQYLKEDMMKMMETLEFK